RSTSWSTPLTNSVSVAGAASPSATLTSPASTSSGSRPSAAPSSNSPPSASTRKGPPRRSQTGRPCAPVRSPTAVDPSLLLLDRGGLLEDGSSRRLARLAAAAGGGAAARVEAPGPRFEFPELHWPQAHGDPHRLLRLAAEDASVGRHVAHVAPDPQPHVAL